MSVTTETKERVKSAPEGKRSSSRKCVHHWIIDSPNGRQSAGLCKRCGKKRSFANSNEAVMWEHTNTLRNNAGSAFRISRTTDVRLSDEVTANE